MFREYNDRIPKVEIMSEANTSRSCPRQLTLVWKRWRLLVL